MCHPTFTRGELCCAHSVLILRRDDFPRLLGPLDLARALARPCSPGMTRACWHTSMRLPRTLNGATAEGIALKELRGRTNVSLLLDCVAGQIFFVVAAARSRDGTGMRTQDRPSEPTDTAACPIRDGASGRRNSIAAPRSGLRRCARRAGRATSGILRGLVFAARAAGARARPAAMSFSCVFAVSMRAR
jgi:hypothetical protein